MDIEIVSDNILLVDGSFLQVGRPHKMYDPQRLGQILLDNHRQIEAAIRNMRARIIGKAEKARLQMLRTSEQQLPRMQKPKYGSVWVMRLTSNEGSLINEKGFYANKMKQQDRDVYRDRSHIKEAFLPYWDAAAQAGFAPEIRRAGGDKDMRGFCLLVRLKGPR